MTFWVQDIYHKPLMKIRKAWREILLRTLINWPAERKTWNFKSHCRSIGELGLFSRNSWSIEFGRGGPKFFILYINSLSPLQFAPSKHGMAAELKKQFKIHHNAKWIIWKKFFLRSLPYLGQNKVLITSNESLRAWKLKIGHFLISYNQCSKARVFIRPLIENNVSFLWKCR